jgi:cytoskeletal protein RodZ
MLYLICRYCELNVFAMITTLGVVSTLGLLTTLPEQFVIAVPFIESLDFSIQSNGDNSGYIVCDPNCHVASNSNSNNSNSNNSNSNNSNSNNSNSNNSGTSGTETQPSYRLTVNVPSHPFGASTVSISISTENGHTDQASVSTAGGSSHTFNIPKDQGKWVQVCVNSGNRSVDRCHTYETTGSDMSVSLSAK